MFLLSYAVMVAAACVSIPGILYVLITGAALNWPINLAFVGFAAAAMYFLLYHEMKHYVSEKKDDNGSD
jgi:membrane protein implicated in regulation of membrane protease activity